MEENMQNLKIVQVLLIFLIKIAKEEANNATARALLLSKIAQF